MDGHEWAERYVFAIRQFEKHLKLLDDGTLKLEAVDGLSSEINDPVIFADLSRSLEITNKMIKSEEISIKQVIGYPL